MSAITNVKRSDLPKINPDSIDVSAVPYEMQEKIKNLIIEKAERKIADELNFLKEEAKMQ